jgi:rhamnogalacturonyl hydrolase YesR
VKTSIRLTHLGAVLAILCSGIAASAQNAGPGGRNGGPGAEGGAGGAGRGAAGEFGRGATTRRGRPPVTGTLPANAPGRDAYWGTWASADPRVVGPRLAMNFLSRPAPRPWGRDQTAGAWYGEACVGFGALRVAQTIGSKELADGVVARYANIITPEGADVVPPADHVDRSVFGIVPFELYKYTQNPAYLALGKHHADEQWGQPPADWRASPEEQASGREAQTKGLTYQTRFWIDDMYMITSVQVQAFRMTHDRVYLDRAAKEMVAYLERLQKPTGLFYHAERSPFYWGRGNGWVAAGLTELLSELPATHPDRPRILEGYQKMMAALLKYQDADGMWHQLIDKPASFKETSCTGMFTFAFATGVRHGLLDEATYKEPTKRAWTALCTYLDENANVREVCTGTNKGDTEEYYMERPRPLGDMHGQAGAIWAAWAMMQGKP